MIFNTSVLANIYVSTRAVDIPNSFLLEAYMGGGYKFAKQQSMYSGFRAYNALIYDYGHKGFALLLGLSWDCSMR